MSIVEVIKNKPNFRSLVKPTAEMISNAQKKLNLQFANEYIQYLNEFGVAVFNGTELTGLGFNNRGEEIADDSIFSVVGETIKARQIFSSLPSDLYVVENCGINSLLVLQDSNGCIYEICEFSDNVEKVADSLLEYIQKK